MKKFDFNVSYLEVSKTTFKITNGGLIPFSTVADTYEEGRTKALEFAQSVARCYNDNEESTLFFRITVWQKTSSQVCALHHFNVVKRAPGHIVKKLISKKYLTFNIIYVIL